MVKATAPCFALLCNFELASFSAHNKPAATRRVAANIAGPEE